MKDVLIIGAGIIGCATAHYLTKKGFDVVVIERNSDVAQQTTIANSGIIHAGEDPEDGTLKAKFNVRGSQMYEDYAKDLQVHYNRCGAFVVASKEEDFSALDELKKRADERGIESEMLSGEEARKEEERLSKSIKRALSLPTTAVVDPWEVAMALAEESVLNGAEVILDSEVVSIEKIEDGYRISSVEESWEAKRVINASGTHAETISSLLAPCPYESYAARGEYYVFDKKEKVTERVVYPVPSNKGKGVLLIPTIHENLLIGPNNDIVALDDVATTRDGLKEVREKSEALAQDIPWNKVIRNFSGIRSKVKGGDFIVEEKKGFKGFIDLIGIDSPGLSAAPAIAEYIYEQFFEASEEIPWKKRTKPLNLREMDPEKRNLLAQKDSDASTIVCRCEQVSKAEILDAIRRPCGARTIKGVKQRARAGSGRCQGGFCEPVIAAILEEEGFKVKLANEGSELFEVKE